MRRPLRLGLLILLTAAAVVALSTLALFWPRGGKPQAPARRSVSHRLTTSPLRRYAPCRSVFVDGRAYDCSDGNRWLRQGDGWLKLGPLRPPPPVPAHSG